jgi:hypothetical protein
MPIDSRAPVALWTRARHVRPLRPLAGSLLVLAMFRPDLAGAQADVGTRAGDSWALDAQYLHLGPDGTSRDATPSLAFTLARRIEVGPGARAMDWRAEAGWLRGVRGGVTAQGITLGLSAGVRTPASRLTLRPGLALLAGWAASQDSSSLYDWRGLPETPQDGTTGTQSALSTMRTRTLGAGVALGAELRVSRALALSASIRHWRFGGRAAAADRDMTLGGIGVLVNPGELARGARRLTRATRRGTSTAAKRPEAGR